MKSDDLWRNIHYMQKNFQLFISPQVNREQKNNANTTNQEVIFYLKKTLLRTTFFTETSKKGANDFDIGLWPILENSFTWLKIKAWDLNSTEMSFF